MIEKQNKYQKQRSFQQRLWFVALFVLLCFALLFVRFIWLQVLHHEQYSQIAKTNRVKPSVLLPVRGSIVDRNGVVLAYNEPSYTIDIKPSEVKDMDALIEKINAIVPVTPREIKRFKQAAAGMDVRFHSVPLRWNLTQEQVAQLSTQLYRLPGAEINVRFIRKYPLRETASHVIGYIHQISEKDQNELEEKNLSDAYRATQYIGREGVEASYEHLLHGVEGFAENEVTSRQIFVRKLREIGAVPGYNLKLTIDVRFQRLVEELYGERRGAFVAIDPRTGEVLALVSKPTFDPNLFIEGFDQETWDAMNDALSRPQFHRAVRSIYPIGSTYKPFMALAGLQTETRKPEDAVIDKGAFVLGRTSWKSAQGGQAINVSRAIAVSNNYYFYSLAYEMGVAKIHEFMEPWGFGQLSGIDLPRESRGVLPSKAWKKEFFTSKKRPEEGIWRDGDTVNLGIGQGFNQFTILQLGTAVAALANNGVKRTPHVLKTSYDIVTGAVQEYQDNHVLQLQVDPEYLQIVRDAMKEVVQKGTARHAFAGALYESAGKTGTAQAASVPRGTRYDKNKLDEYKRDHSLYIAFAPADDPVIAIAIVVENAGFGATSAVPIVRRALDYYILGVYPSQSDIEAVRKGYAGPPRGTPRSTQEYDIIPAEQLISLDAVTDGGSMVDAQDISPNENNEQASPVAQEDETVQ